MGHAEDLRRDGFAVVRGLLDRARTARLLEIAHGLRSRYLQRDPVTGRRGFLVSGWAIAHIEHPGFHEGAPEWWLPEIAALVSDPAVLDVWRTGTGDEPEFASASLYVDPLVREGGPPDGAGGWHRDRTALLSDEEERAVLLRDDPLREGGFLLELALLPSDAFEYVAGSHVRWDTPRELVARKHGSTDEECTQPLPGACRPLLAAGDALLADTSGIHRGWYAYGVPRRTIALSYLSAARLARYPEERHGRSLLDAEQLRRVDLRARAYFGRELVSR
jgi:hypothetical protein